MSLTIGAVVALLEMVAKITEKIIKSKSEKLSEKWEKDLPELAEAVENGDQAVIDRISAEWADSL